MVRQRTRKSVEELYGTKFDANTAKPQGHAANKNARTTDRDFGGYIITSNTPYNASCPPSNTTANSHSSNHCTTNRNPRKSSRQPQSKQDKFYPVPDDKSVNMDNHKKDHIITKPKSSRSEKPINMNVYPQAGYTETTKIYSNFAENNPKENGSHHHSHHGHAHSHNHMHASIQDEEKEDDTEEFFELIRQTVENAIGKSISEVLNRNFRELSAKIDRFSMDLKQTNALLNKLQSEINNKVVHYGEENSRHFRYLCMKSEYDKMFYQHHTMMASNAPTPPADKRQKNEKSKNSDKTETPCTCRSTKTISEPHKTSSEEHDMSAKSSEMGMREVLEHIQRFCNQIQMTDTKIEDRTVSKNSFRLDDPLKMNKADFEDDEEEFQLSSDGMTPRSDDQISKYGSSTIRNAVSSRGATGGGDA